MKSLRWDYKIRIIITLMIFIASGIVIGILSLLPSYIISYTLERDLVNKVETIQKDRSSTGIDNVIKELNKSYAYVRVLKIDKPRISFLGSVEELLALRTKNVTISSFEVASTSQQEDLSEMVIQGNALTRESLLNFKRGIEADQNISNVELPISDLAKSKDISFAIKFWIRKPHEK